MAGPARTPGTLAYYCSQLWVGINARACNGQHFNEKKFWRYRERGIRLEIDKATFYGWMREQWPKIEALVNAGRKPSVDRKDNSKGYFLDNMQILDQALNSSKDKVRPVVSIDKDGTVQLFESMSAADLHGFNHRHISTAIRKGNTHGKRHWRLATKEEIYAHAL